RHEPRSNPAWLLNPPLEGHHTIWRSLRHAPTAPTTFSSCRGVTNQACTAIMSRVQIFESEVVGSEVRDRPTETKVQPTRSGLALDRLVLSGPGPIHGPAGAQSESCAGGGSSGSGSGSGRGRSTNDDGRGAAPETGGDEPTTPRAEPAVDSRTEDRHGESQCTGFPGCTASDNSGRTAPC